MFNPKKVVLYSFVLSFTYGCDSPSSSTAPAPQLSSDLGLDSSSVLPPMDRGRPTSIGSDESVARLDAAQRDAGEPNDAQPSDALFDVATLDFSMRDAALSDAMANVPDERLTCQRGFESLPVIRDIAYADLHPRQRLDLYPLRSEHPTPLVIWVHGGGWRGGSKDRVLDEILAFRERGYAIVSVEYRLSDAPWPATVVDVKAAVRFLRANAEEYNLDPERFVAMGSSAGGHLVSMLGVSPDVEIFRDDALGHRERSDAVQAVVNFYGPTELDMMDADAMSSGCPPNALCHDCEGSPESLLIDCRPSQCRALAAQASPITYIDGDEAPFLSFHGTDDCTVPIPQARRLHMALQASGAESTLVEVERAGHNTRECLAGDNARLMYAFVERTIRGCSDEAQEEPEVPEDSSISECHWRACAELAQRCEESAVCVALELCFQDCFERQLGQCIRRCLDSVPDAESAIEAHRPLFECGRANGCYR